jgi:NAD(P)-dependent dehydrogenase (short-subunit alcohol dehydrogenase family)
VSANAGIGGLYRSAWEFSRDEWQAVIDVDLTGVWQTAKAAAPAMISQGSGGSIVITSSTMGMKGLPNMIGYVAAKYGGDRRDVGAGARAGPVLDPRQRRRPHLGGH